MIPFPRSEIAQSIPSRFEKQVTAHPESLAVVNGERSLSYEALNIQANRLAWDILSKNLKKGPVVCLCEQGVEFIVAILGILKSGSFYVPMDPQASDGSIIGLLSQIDPTCIVVDQRGLERLKSLPKTTCPTISLESIDSGLPLHNPSLDISPDSLAYIYFTTGTTGEPKGVVDNHRNVLHNVMRYTNSLPITSSDRLTLLHAPNLSACVSSQFGALLNGACVFPNRIQAETTDKFSEWLVDKAITIYHSIPQLIHFALDETTKHSSLRWIRLEGNQAQPKDLEVYQRFAPPTCRLVNGFGTTETGICSQFFFDKSSELPEDSVPIGYPVEDMEAVVLNKDLSSETGEIAVRSHFLSIGYWKNDVLTKQAFQTDPGNENLRTWMTGDLGGIGKDGSLVLSGRKTEGNGTHTRPPAHPTSTKPLTELEKQLAKYWSDLLNQETINMEDNFIELGGDSLKAIRLMNRIKAEFSIQLSLREILDNGTLEALTRLLNQRMNDSKS